MLAKPSPVSIIYIPYTVLKNIIKSMILLDYHSSHILRRDIIIAYPYHIAHIILQSAPTIHNAIVMLMVIIIVVILILRTNQS